jgi:hypothetical protein
LALFYIVKTKNNLMKAKNENATQNKNLQKKEDKANKKKGISSPDVTTGATSRVKPRAGQGLANEGTLTSYNEER